MLKLKCCGLTVDLELLHGDYFRERFREYADGHSGRPDLICVSHLAAELSAPEGKEKRLDPFKKCVTLEDGTICSVSNNPEGETTFIFRVSPDASRAEMWFRENYTYRYSTRTAMEYRYSCNAFCDRLALEGDMVLHGAAIGFRGKGVVFSARPGVGKSTQASLWEKLWPKETVKINEDWPAVCFPGGVPTLCGIPWSGSDPVNRDISLPMGALVLIRRGGVPRIERLRPADVFAPVYRELCVSHYNKRAAEAVYDALGRLLEKTPVYMLDCTMGEETPRLALEAFEKDGIV